MTSLKASRTSYTLMISCSSVMISSLRLGYRLRLRFGMPDTVSTDVHRLEGAGPKPRHDSRKAAGKSGIRGLSCPGRSAPTRGRPILIPCRNLSDALSVEVVTLGKDREPGVPVMSNIPLELQRSCEQRWAARFARPVPPSAPHEHMDEKSDQADPDKGKKKTRRAKLAGLRPAPAE
jgi:hypothetical protein